jgi:hypothetical protein
MRRFVYGWKRLGHMSRLQARIVNYADDFVICCRGTAQKAAEAMRRMMSGLKLTVNESKTHVCEVPAETFDFLGYTFGVHRSKRTGRKLLCGAPSAKRLARVCEKISVLTRRQRGHLSEEQMVYELNQVLRGWAGYFCLGPVSTAYRKVNSHVRWRFRRWWERKHKRLIQRPALVLESLAGGEVWSAPVEVGPLAPAARESVNLLREPDAANPQVRFDKREVETEQGKAIEAPATERAGQRIRPNLNHRATSRLYPSRRPSLYCPSRAP